MLETMKYVRKPFYIDAVQVTAQNLQDVAAWATGEVRTDTDGQYVKVRVYRPLNDRQTKAYLGDWVLYAGTGFKVYNDKAFKNSFEQASVETTMHNTAPVFMEESEAEKIVRLHDEGLIETPVPLEGVKPKTKPRPRKPATIVSAPETVTSVDQLDQPV